MADYHYNSAQLVLPVNDMTAARTWYEDRLGFETVFLNSDDDDPDGNFATLIGDTARLMLIPSVVSRRQRLPVSPGQNVEGVHAFVTERESDAELVKQSWGAKGFHLEDPSGNLILIAEDLNE